MITIDNVQYRNLEEQVKKNMDDIQYILEEEGVLNEFGIKIVGQITSSSQLPDPDTYEGEFGDAYAVGESAPYTLYIYTRANGTHPNDYWFNIGQFPLAGKDGAQGPIGPTGPQGIRGSTWTNGTSSPTTSGNLANDKYLNTTNGDVYNYTGTTWQLVGNIRGPQGIQGLQGNVGPAGQQGIQGPKGDKGDPGPAFVIAGTVASEGQLPDPSTLADNIAYLVGSNNDYDLYVQLQDTQTWQNVGKVEGVQGPEGPQGKPGPVGPQGIQGVQGPAGTNGANGRGIQSVISGSPIISGNQTQTPITVSYSDNTTSNFTVYAERGEQGPQGIQGVPGVAGPKGDTGPQGPAGEVDYSQVYTKEEVDSGFIKSSGETSRTGTLPITVENFLIPGIKVTSDDGWTGNYNAGDITFIGHGASLVIHGAGQITLHPPGSETQYRLKLPRKDGTLAVTDDITTALQPYATTQYVDSKVSAVYKYKGSVATYNNLPSSGQTVGDVYNVEDTGDNYAWDGTTWDKLSGTVDLSAYATTANMQTYVAQQLEPYATTANVTSEIETATNDMATNASVTSQLSTKQDTLVSGTNIKTINGNSLLGSGDLTISGGGGEVPVVTVTDLSTPLSDDDFNKLVNNDVSYISYQDVLYGRITSSTGTGNTIEFTCTDFDVNGSPSNVLFKSLVLQKARKTLSSSANILNHKSTYNFYAKNIDGGNSYNIKYISFSISTANPNSYSLHEGLVYASTIYDILNNTQSDIIIPASGFATSGGTRYPICGIIADSSYGGLRIILMDNNLQNDNYLLSPPFSTQFNGIEIQ